jgi:hypothetical protein
LTECGDPGTTDVEIAQGFGNLARGSIAQPVTSLQPSVFTML